MSRWSDIRGLFVRHAEAFGNATRYEEASAIADKAAREIEALAASPQPEPVVGDREAVKESHITNCFLMQHQPARADYLFGDGGSVHVQLDGYAIVPAEHYWAVIAERDASLASRPEGLGALQAASQPSVPTCDGDGADLVFDEPIGDDGKFTYRTTIMGERHIVDKATGFVWFKLPYDYRFTSNAGQRRDAETILAALTSGQRAAMPDTSPPGMEREARNAPILPPPSGEDG